MSKKNLRGEIERKAQKFASNFKSQFNTIIGKELHDIIVEGYIAGATEYAQSLPVTGTEPYGYVFENHFYKSLDQLSGQTFSEGNEPVAVFRKTDPSENPEQLK